VDAILVTGGAGFIGANFVRHALAHADARVVVLDKLTYAGNLQSLAQVSSHPRYVFVEGDIADRETVRAIFREQRPAAVVNFAAESDGISQDDIVDRLIAITPTKEDELTSDARFQKIFAS